MLERSSETRPGRADEPGTHPTEGHEPWCDVAGHEQLFRDGQEGALCISAPIEPGGEQAAAGWLTKNDTADGSVRIAVDWQPGDWKSLTLAEAASLVSFLGHSIATTGAR